MFRPYRAISERGLEIYVDCPTLSISSEFWFYWLVHETQYFELRFRTAFPYVNVNYLMLHTENLIYTHCMIVDILVMLSIIDALLSS
jgi:hypothetical protein